MQIKGCKNQKKNQKGEEYCTGRFADDLALGAVIVFREENAGRLADDLAMGTGIRISNVNAGRLANDPAIVQSIEFVTKMVFAFQLTSPWVQS